MAAIRLYDVKISDKNRYEQNDTKGGKKLQSYPIFKTK
jgi:hypothetical protein